MFNEYYNPYEKYFYLGTSECDINGTWKLCSILEVVQNTANEHDNMLHIWHKDLILKNVSWVLSKTEIMVDRYLRIGETAEILTYTKGIKALFYPRYYIIRDERKNIVARIGSLLMLIDRDTRKAVSPKDIGIVIPDVSNMDPSIKISMRKSNVKGSEIHTQRTPQYSEVDVNGHVNNTKYVEWLCNDFGFGIMKDREIESASIDYRMEILPEQVIENTYVLNGNTFQYIGCVKDKCSFEIRGMFRSKYV